MVFQKDILIIYTPSNFVVLEMDNACEIPLIFRRPFLAMTQANINVSNKRMTLTMERKEVQFKLYGVT